MGIKLISHVNRDNDLIEAWLRFYRDLGIESVHLVVHGGRDENAALFAIKDCYPVVIEDMYDGEFSSQEKKSRLDAVLARHTEQWLLLVDSDEFVEFPYGDIASTIEALDAAHSSAMVAPMLQRLTADGSLDTPPTIDDPFGMLPLCSIDLYLRMGVKADIFKFPLFYCRTGTTLSEAGNHHPPLGTESSDSGIRGVTHHFKFRRTASQRLSSRINSNHTWRQESVLFQKYLEGHSNRLPLDGSFAYSRTELFRRGLLKQRRLPVIIPKEKCGAAQADFAYQQQALQPKENEKRSSTESRGMSLRKARRITFLLPKATVFGGLEKHLLELLCSLPEEHCNCTIVCFGQDLISARLSKTQSNWVKVSCQKEPATLREWLQVMRESRPQVLVFCYSWIEAFPWQAPLAGLLAGVRARFAIQHLIPPPFPPPCGGISPSNLLRRLIGQRARRLLQIRFSGNVFSKTICVSHAVRQALVNSYGFSRRKTISIPNGVSTSFFAPPGKRLNSVRAELDIEPDEFLLVCVARLVESKGIDVLLQAVGRVIHQGVRVKCIVVGDGPLRRSLESLVNSLGISGYTFLVGFQEDVRPYLQAASAFILLSELEGLPLSVLEAMACALPCIVTDVGGNREAVEHQKVGFVIPPGSIDDAEEAILFLATHPRERDEMAARARQRVLQSFNLPTSMARFTELLLT